MVPVLVRDGVIELSLIDTVMIQDRNNANYKHFGAGWDTRTNGYHVSYKKKKRI